MKRASCLLLALGMLVFMVAQSHASVQLNTFPSAQFIRSTGEPNTETRTFSGIGGPAIIRLINGDLTDTTVEKVSSSEIRVNGLLVFGPSDFNQNMSTLEKDIMLNDGVNMLSVLLKGKPGGTVLIQIVQILDNIRIDPPKILLQEVGATSQITVTGELSNGTVVDVTDPSRGTIYSSLKPGVVTVSPSGLVTAVANGDTNIVVKNGLFGANIPVTVQITQSTRTVGQDGGTLNFHNGLVLEVPPGAVPGPTTILIKDLPLDQVTAILSNPLLTSDRTKRFLGGFSAEPDGLVFKIPVMATIPVLPLNPYEIPAQVEILLNEQRYRYVTSQFEYLGDQGVARVSIQHFSDPTIIGLTGPEFQALCRVCPANNAPFPAECNVDPLQLPCCNLYPQVRATCPQASGCHCCREGRIEVVEVSTDFMTNECQVLGSDLRIRYVDCPGSPTESDSVSEKACKDIDLKITIKPDQPDPWTIAVRDQQQFKAFITGTWNNGPRQGNTAFENQSIDPIWRSAAPEIADFVGQLGQQGWITGIKSNPDPIQIYAMLGEEKGVARVKVTGDYIEIRIEPETASTFLCPGQWVILRAFLMNSAQEEIFEIDVNWTIENSVIINNPNNFPIVSCDPCNNVSSTKITASNFEGMAEVKAYNGEYNLFTSIGVDVWKEVPKISITSYKNGGRAYVTGVNLVGTIEECGSRRVKFIQVTNGSDISLLRPVGDDGKFSIMVNLHWGMNYLTITTYDANNGRVPNNMEGKFFTLRRVPHCAKVDGNSPMLPTVLYGTPVNWVSEKPSIATVDAIPGDPNHVAVVGHANGWTRITADWHGYTLVRWVGVSTGTNYVATHQDDPFYEPEHVPNPAVVQMLWQIYGRVSNLSDANDRYFIGWYSTDAAFCYGWSFEQRLGFLYDGASIQSIYPSTADCFSHVYPLSVNEIGQVVGDIAFIWPGGSFSLVGFLYDHGMLSYVADPYAYNTQLQDINNLGKAIGTSNNGAGYDWGFIYDVGSGTFTYIAPYPMYINDSGQVLGHIDYFPNGASLWLYKDGVYEPVVGQSYINSYSLHESGQVYVQFGSGQSVLLTRCAPEN